MADLLSICTAPDPRPDVIFLTEVRGRASHVTSLLRSHGYVSHYHPVDPLKAAPPELPETRLPRLSQDPIGCLIAYRTDTSWANYVRKTSRQAPMIAPPNCRDSDQSPEACPPPPHLHLPTGGWRQAVSRTVQVDRRRHPNPVQLPPTSRHLRV
jgi:hypothetical protein